MAFTHRELAWITLLHRLRLAHGYTLVVEKKVGRTSELMNVSSVVSHVPLSAKYLSTEIRMHMVQSRDADGQ